MRHLDDVELVDWIDRALPDERAAHLDACAACRERVDALRTDLERLQTAADRVPEPSPLFWTHFSRRVHDAVHDLPAAPDRRAWFRPAYWAGAAAAVALAALVLVWNVVPPARPADTRVASVATESVAPLSDPWNVNLDDEEWALVQIVADDVLWEDAQDAGITPGPGSAERVALELSSAERQELVRLLTQLLTPNS